MSSDDLLGEDLFASELHDDFGGDTEEEDELSDDMFEDDDVSDDDDLDLDDEDGAPYSNGYNSDEWN